MIDDLDTPRWLADDAIRSTGVAADTLRNWLDPARSVVVMGQHDRRAGGSGRPHLLTLRRVYQIALVQELVRIGIAPHRAGPAAATFTDAGSEDRLPGRLYKSGLTILIVHSEGARVVHMPTTSDAVDLVASIFAPGPAAAVVNVGAVAEQVLASLNSRKAG